MVDGTVQLKNLTLVGTSGALRSVDGFIEKAAQADCPVLIQGEFGVGKKHVAYALHAVGLRHDHPFVHVRCDALDLYIFASYLFKQALGVSFKPFLAIVRIEKARQWLIEQPHWSITRISGEVGFDDLRHFERTFKRLTGSTPRAYRQSALLS